MVSVYDLLDCLNKPKTTRVRVHIDDSLAIYKLSTELTQMLQESSKKEPPIILCIGTDRSTGDSLGPLTGWHLATFLKNSTVDLYGTVDTPVHASNLNETLIKITDKITTRPIIAVDACLGNANSTGSILLEQGSLKPGSSLKKDLPPVGDISISGIVNVGGFMELQILQSTRLSLVMKMSQIIAHSIFIAVHKDYKK